MAMQSNAISMVRTPGAQLWPCSPTPSLAMYHDQGHIAIEVHNLHESVTATLGIPLIRASVDHGTAFDIAGKGVADATGALAALQAAATLAEGTLDERGSRSGLG